MAGRERLDFKFFGEEIIGVDGDINFDKDQAKRILELLEFANEHAPEDVDFLLALIQVLNEACGNVVGYTNFETIISTLENKYYNLP